MRFIRAVFFSVLACAALAPLFAYADTTSDQRAALEAQLVQVQAQIQQNQAQLAQEQTQRASYERDVSILDSQIQEAQLEIKQRDLTIQQLKDGIAQSETGIAGVDANVAAGEQSLAQILRETQQIDDTSLVQLFLDGNGSLTDAFQDIDDFQTIQKSLGTAFTQMAAQRSDLAAREQSLQSQQQDQSDLLQAQVAQQNSLKVTEKQKQDLVDAAKGQESIYQQIIASKQETVTQIETALFNLRDTSAVSFGNMYSYAKEAYGATSVSPAFILGILSEESNLGQDDGSCTYQDAMNPTRDVPVFLTLMQQLGLDPDSEKVSCAPSYGWGGAMGPAQFIPSTWALYEDRIASASGQTPPNPWDPRTAAFATAIYMSDLGADAGTPAAEREAALKYFAGSHWQNPTYAFYGDDVMCLTEKVQGEIDVLNGTGSSGDVVDCN
jgi:membrane-bound lytic murein transglycosylase B